MVQVCNLKKMIELTYQIIKKKTLKSDIDIFLRYNIQILLENNNFFYIKLIMNYLNS